MISIRSVFFFSLVTVAHCSSLPSSGKFVVYSMVTRSMKFYPMMLYRFNRSRCFYLRSFYNFHLNDAYRMRKYIIIKHIFWTFRQKQLEQLINPYRWSVKHFPLTGDVGDFRSWKVTPSHDGKYARTIVVSQYKWFSVDALCWEIDLVEVSWMVLQKFREKFVTILR